MIFVGFAIAWLLMAFTDLGNQSTHNFIELITYGIATWIGLWIIFVVIGIIWVFWATRKE